MALSPSMISIIFGLEKDIITDKARLAKIEQLSNLNLMPKRIFIEIRKQDSLRHAKDLEYLLSKGYIKSIKDTVGLDEDQFDNDEFNNLKKEKPAKKNRKDKELNSQAVLPSQKKNINLKAKLKSPKRNLNRP